MTYTCPECGATSHHPTDEEVGWCGRCGAFTGGKSGLELRAILAEMVERGDPAVAGLANRIRIRQREEKEMDRNSVWTPMKQETLSEGLGPAVDELWENEAFLCTVRYEPVTGGLVGRDGLLALWISRRDGEPIGDAANVTRVKDDVAGASRIGLTQAEDDVTLAHVWVLPEGIALPELIEGGER